MARFSHVVGFILIAILFSVNVESAGWSNFHGSHGAHGFHGTKDIFDTHSSHENHKHENHKHENHKHENNHGISQAWSFNTHTHVSNHHSNQGSNSWGGYLNGFQNIFNDNLKNLKNMWGDWTKFTTGLQGFQIQPDGTFQLTFQPGSYNSESLKLIFQLIIRVLKSLSASAGNAQVTLSNGRTVTWSYIINTLQKIFRLRSPSQLTTNDKAVLDFVWSKIQESGFKINGLTDIGGADQESWMHLWTLLHKDVSASSASIKTPNGQPLTWALIWEYLEEEFRGKKSIRLPSGQKVTVKYILGILQGKHHRKRKVSQTEHEVWQYIWSVLQSHGFSIVGESDEGDEATTLEFLLQDDVEKPETSNTITLTMNGQPIDIQQIAMILLKKLGGQKFITVDDEKINMNYIFKILEGRNGKKLDSKEISVLMYLWNILKESGIKIGDGSDSWLSFYNYLLQLNGDESSRQKWKSLELDLKKPSFQLPNVDLSGIWKTSFKFLQNLPGLNVQPGGQIHLSWQRGKFNPDIVKVVWEIIYKILGQITNGNADKTIDLGNGVTLTMDGIIKILQNSLTAKRPKQLSGEEKLVWAYIWNLLQQSGFQIDGLRGRQGNQQSWIVLWRILSQQPDLSFIDDLMGQFASAFDWAKNFQMPTIPPFVWNPFSKFHLPEIPHIDFGSLLNGINGLNFDNGKIQFAWTGGNFNADAVAGVWKLVMNLLQQIQKGSSDNMIDLGNGIKLTADQLLALLQQSLTATDPQQLGNQAKLVWEYVWNLLTKSGFNIVGFNSGGGSWEILFNILHSIPTISSNGNQWPTIDLAGMVNSLRNIPGFTLSPGGKIDIDWQKLNFNPSSITGVLKIVWGIFQQLQKQSSDNLIEIGNGVKLTTGDLIALLKKSLSVTSPQEISDEAKLAWDYVWNVLKNSGINFLGIPQTNEDEGPWVVLWNLFHSKINLPDFNWSLSQTDIPTLKWPDLQFPHLKFDAIWSDLFNSGSSVPGISFIPGGKVQLSWQDGNISPSAVEFIWKFILHSLDLLNKYSTDKSVDFGNGIKLTLDEITDIIKQTAGSTGQLSDKDKAAWGFITLLLRKGGFSITGLADNDGIPSWTAIWRILNQNPIPPVIEADDNDNKYIELVQEHEEETTVNDNGDVNEEPTTAAFDDYNYDYGDDDGLVIVKVGGTELDDILQTVKTEADSGTGDIQYQGYTIPISFILSAIDIRKYDVQTLSTTELEEILNAYIDETKKAEDNETSDELPKETQLILSFILDDLKKNGVDNSGSIVFEGKQIPKDYIINILKIQGIDIEKVTPEVLYRIFLLYLNDDKDTDPVSSNLQSVLQQLLAFIQQNGDRSSGSLLVNNHQISIQTVVATMKLQKIDIKTATTDDLWKIILLIISTQEASSATVDQKSFVYNYFVEILSNPKNVPYSKLVLDGHEIPVLDTLTCLGVEKDEGSGKYPMDDVTKEDLWNCLQIYITDHSNETTEVSKQKMDAFKYFMQIIEDPDNVPNGLLVITINGEEKQIPLINVVEDLKLEKDSETGKYIVDDVTPDTLWSIIDTYFNDAGTEEEE